MRPNRLAITLLACAVVGFAFPTEAAGGVKLGGQCDGDPVCEVICNQNLFWAQNFVCWVKSCAGLCTTNSPLDLLP